MTPITNVDSVTSLIERPAPRHHPRHPHLADLEIRAGHLPRRRRRHASTSSTTSTGTRPTSCSRPHSRSPPPAPKATYEIPYGSIERPTTRNNSWEKAKFEVPALRWADLGDAEHGFSLINESKYGYDAEATSSASPSSAPPPGPIPTPTRAISTSPTPSTRTPASGNRPSPSAAATNSIRRSSLCRLARTPASGAAIDLLWGWIRTTWC